MQNCFTCTCTVHLIRIKILFYIIIHVSTSLSTPHKEIIVNSINTDMFIYHCFFAEGEADDKTRTHQWAQGILDHQHDEREVGTTAQQYLSFDTRSHTREGRSHQVLARLCLSSVYELVSSIPHNSSVCICKESK